MSGDLKKSLCTIGEGEKNKEGGRGGEEDVIMTFSYVKMWWRFFNATLS